MLHTLRFSEQQKIVLTKLLLLKICTYNYTEKGEEEEMTIDIMPISHLSLLRNLLHKGVLMFLLLVFYGEAPATNKAHINIDHEPKPNQPRKKNMLQGC